jgi:SAM-dependent methyltransferase
MPELDLRNDVYRRPLQTALERLGVGPGWLCADIGAGGGDVTVALAAVVGHRGRVYAVDIDPSRRDEVAQAAADAGEAQVVAITQAAEDLLLPEKVDLAYCRFLLMHVVDPLAVLRRMASVTRPGGWLLAQEPITSAGRVAGAAMSMPSARHPDIGALLPGLVRDAGLELVDAWAEAQAGAGAGPVAGYLEDLTGVSPGRDPVVLPPLVTVMARKPTAGA